MSLSIPKEIMDEMINHSKEELPNESCGYLAGKDGEVHKLIRMHNTDQEPDHFTFEPKEQFAAVKAARQDGLSLLSVYHSHPSSPARPSAEDLRLLKDPNMIYVIVSLETEAGDVKAYRIVDGNVSNIEINESGRVLS